MVNSTLKTKTSPSIQIKSKNTLTPNILLRNKNADDVSLKYIDSHSQSSKKKTPQPVSIKV
jgi:hypothetical protein